LHLPSIVDLIRIKQRLEYRVTIVMRSRSSGTAAVGSSSSSGAGGGGSSTTLPQDYPTRKRLVERVGAHLEGCLQMGERVEMCENEKGANNADCQKLLALQIHCYGELLCPTLSKRALTCLRTHGRPDPCVEDITKLRACVDPGLTQLVRNFDGETNLMARTEKECNPVADLLDQCRIRNKGDYSKCQAEVQQLNMCVGGVTCPSEMTQYRNCLSSKGGDESKCQSEERKFSECVVDSKLQFYSLLGIPLHEFDSEEY